mmetsp:Transcript_83416/g.135222  ORF Transcript_83416/g.135222 Transcript_83416/m.135222 type:complete len:248 (+) Transcript_83416:169-912(+)
MRRTSHVLLCVAVVLGAHANTLNAFAPSAAVLKREGHTFMCTQHTGRRVCRALLLRSNLDGFENNDMEMLRKRMAHAKEQATKLPGPNLTPEQVISETLKMLQQTENDDTPYCDAGVNVVLRLASNRFKLQLRWLVGSCEQPRALSSVFRNADSQFHLLLCNYDHHFPLDTYYIDEARCFVDVQFDAPENGGGDKKGRKWNGMLAKLGFEMIRNDDGHWVYDSIIWHDFRDGFRPGIGQEEWPRICG